MNDDVIIRPSIDTDIPAITGIYGYHVQHGAGSFETEPPDREEIGRRRSGVLQNGLPWLIAECRGQVAGYAYASPYRPRLAYRFTLEDSIYIHPDWAGKGIGTLLLPQLIERCEETGARQLIAVIGDIANTASIKLHERCGFRHVGVLQSVGFKFERWLDAVLMQRPLGPDDGNR